MRKRRGAPPIVKTTSLSPSRSPSQARLQDAASAAMRLCWRANAIQPRVQPFSAERDRSSSVAQSSSSTHVVTSWSGNSIDVNALLTPGLCVRCSHRHVEWDFSTNDGRQNSEGQVRTDLEPMKVRDIEARTSVSCGQPTPGGRPHSCAGRITSASARRPGASPRTSPASGAGGVGSSSPSPGVRSSRQRTSERFPAPLRPARRAAARCSSLTSR